MSRHRPPPAGPAPGAEPGLAPGPPGPASAGTRPPVPAAAPPPDPYGARPALAAGWATALLLLLGLGAWGHLARIEGAILAQGQIAAARTRIALQHPEGGRVVDLLVAEGAEVAAGQPLLRLDPGLLTAEAAVVEDQYAATLARAARLVAERDARPDLPPPDPAAAGVAGLADHLDGQRRLFALRRDALAHELAQLDLRRAQTAAEAEGLAAQQAAVAAERRLVEAELARDEGLAAAGVVAPTRLVPLRREALRLAATEAAIAAGIAAAASRLAEIDLAAVQARAQRREEAEAGLREIAPLLADLAARRAAIAARLEALVLRAPAAGRINGLALAGPGAVIRAAEPLAEIVPAGPPGLALLQILPQDIDRLHPGQPVRLLLPATGGRSRPELEGRIVQISAGPLEEARSGLRHFVAEVAFDPTGGPEALPLMPGQPVEAQIRTGARSPLDWLLAPLTRTLDRALRPD